MSHPPVRSALPEVSVVVIVFNDGARLWTAVRSALDQSHRGVEVIVVDDGSTDGTTPRAVDEVAATWPDRVRVIHRAENSGAGGQPRNDGIAVARGTFVMFLDSDDTLDRHACRNMVVAAEETGADFVSAVTWRVMVDQGTEHAWFGWLYRRRAVYSSIRERMDLLYDTLSTNKCYRLDFLERAGLRFPPGLRYEDLLFTAQVYLAAEKIAIIPHRVYDWNVVPKARNLSVTNRRAELSNWADRLEIHRRIDAAFEAVGAEDLRLRNGAKFLNHDLVLYVRELRARSREYRDAFLKLARDHLADLDPRAFEECNEIPAIVGFMIMQGDYQAAIDAVDLQPAKGQQARLSAELAERDGRVYWSADHLDKAGARRILDVTDLGIHSLPLAGLALGGRVLAVREHAGLLHLDGDCTNPLGRITAGDEVGAVVEFRDRGRARRHVKVPATVRHEGGRLHWTAEVDTARKVRPLGLFDQSWRMLLHLSVGDDTLEVRLSATEAATAGVRVPVRPRLSRLAGDHFEAFVPESGDMAFRIVGQDRPARWTLPALRRLAATRWGRRLFGGLLRQERSIRGRLNRVQTKQAVFNRVLIRLPVKKGTIVFESHLGKQYSDNPKYIHEALRRSDVPHKAIWSYATSKRGFPKDAVLVRRNSWAYHRALARAQYWVDNQGFPHELTKRRQTTYLQTWHGSAYKRMGFDTPDLKAAPQGEQRRLRRAVGRFDYFLIRSEHDVGSLARGLGVRAELLRCGYPRNDALLSGDPAAVQGLRTLLRLPAGRKIVLYAPTFRADADGRPDKRLEVPFGLERFAERLGDTHTLLIRPHYLSAVVIPPSLHGVVRDVSQVHDVTPLYLLADALVTDYSSVMFDYVLLDRPMVFYTPDAEDYGHARGSYLDLAEHAPGPIVKDQEALFTALGDLEGISAGYGKKRRRFVERFGEYDTGTAAAQVVERVFASGGDGHA